MMTNSLCKRFSNFKHFFRLPYTESKTIMLGCEKTIFYASRKQPPDGRYDFKVELEKKRNKTRFLYVILRPGLRKFLEAAKKASFVIVPVTTWSTSRLSDILDQIDPSRQFVSHCMTKPSHCDLLTGRLLDRTVMVDYKPQIYNKPWDNAILVSRFSGDRNDVQLLDLCSFFTVQRTFTDLRTLVHISSGDPHLPGLPLPETTRKTLFLDLDETLICHVCLHDKPPVRYDFVTNDICYVTKRPGVDMLLQYAVDHDYEVVIFTAGSREYASPIIDKLDPLGLITHRLYQDSCKEDSQGKAVKDLALTGRSLARSIIFDDKIYRVAQSNNVVMVRPFSGDMRDTELQRLLLLFHIDSTYEDLRVPAKWMNDSFRPN